MAYVTVGHVSVDANPPTQKEWPLGLFECFCYKNAKGDCTYIPFFIPMAVCGTCCLLGRIRTIYVEEPPMCLGLGKQGCGICLLSVPIKLVEPIGGFCWFVANSAAMRTQVVEKYHIQDVNKVCCFSVPTCCVGCLYPCSLYQVLMSLHRFEDIDIPRERKDGLRTPLTRSSSCSCIPNISDMRRGFFEVPTSTSDPNGSSEAHTVPHSDMKFIWGTTWYTVVIVESIKNCNTVI